MFDPVILFQDFSEPGVGPAIPAGGAPTTALTFLGWLFLLVSTLSMTVWVIWCFRRVLTLPREEAPPPPPPGFGP